jgi:hypothetical protein
MSNEDWNPLALGTALQKLTVLAYDSGNNNKVNSFNKC